MGSPDSTNTTLTVFAMTGVLMLAACGGGEGTPRPEASGGTGGVGATGGTGGTTGGTGGTTGGSAGAPVEPVEECPTPSEWTGGSISAVEMDGDRLDTNRGGWYFFHAGATDGCPTCMTTPAPGDPPVVVLEEPDPPRADSTKALHWAGSGWVVAATYGAGVGIYLDNCASVASDVTGVSFYYMSSHTLSFGSEQAGVDYQKDFAPAADWTEASIAFTDLIPATGTGTLDKTKIARLFWRVPKPVEAEGGTFSVWLDDIAWIGGS
jgi:hypothetical protein